MNSRLEEISPAERRVPSQTVARHHGSRAVVLGVLVAAAVLSVWWALQMSPPFPVILRVAAASAAAGLWALLRWRSQPRFKMAVAAVALVLIASPLAARTYLRYDAAEVMRIPVREFTNAEYPEDPAPRSRRHGQYQGRELTLVQKDDRHFDFIFEPRHPHIARIVFRDVDVSLMTPSLPAWTKEDTGLQRIALTDRQWNRQQVRFDAGSVHVEVSGGDGFEVNGLFTAELAKNCLNAGLWEVLLFTNESGSKELYYQGWFSFPMGHYKRLFEQNTGLSYARHWHYLEHWMDPAGTQLKMQGLREVVREREVHAHFDPDAPVIAGGEQLRKRRTLLAQNYVTWKDAYQPGALQFASFVPPGVYRVEKPWKNRFPEIAQFQQALVRDIRSPGSEHVLQEIELVFVGSGNTGVRRFFVSGIALQDLPQLPVADYSRGLYMPMAIGSPPFYQGYDELAQRPPHLSTYVSVLLDEDDRWIDHHSFGIDGVAMHRDEADPARVHLYLLSYERHTLIGHFVLST